jgi:hypothetical protein
VFDHFDLLARFYDRAIRFAHLERMLDFVGLPADGLLLGDRGETNGSSVCQQLAFGRLDAIGGLSYPGPR